MIPQPEKDNSNFWPVFGRIMLFAGIISIGVYLLWTSGEKQKNYKSETDTIQNNIKNLTTIDSTVLMEVSENGKNAIFIKNTSDKGWTNISMPDYTVSMASLSPNQNFIAFLSGKKEKSIIIKDLIKDTSTQIVFKLVPIKKLSNQSSRLQNSIICYWTPLKWSPKSDKLAFFVSYANSKNSYLVVLNLTEPDKYKISGVDSIEDELINRKIEWPNSNTILSTYSDKDFNIITVNQCIIIQ